MRMITCACFAAGLLSWAGCGPTGPSAPAADAGSAKPAASAAALGTDISVPYEGALHVDTGQHVTYQTNPPASGSHWPDDAEPGFYDTVIEPEQWVHNLEHGHIVILYDCGGAPCEPELLANLQRFATDLPRVLVTPYAGLPKPATLVAIAWNWQMCLDHFDEQALLGFYARHFDHAPESGD